MYPSEKREERGSWRAKKEFSSYNSTTPKRKYLLGI